MTEHEHQPAVIWCPNCGAALSAPVKISATRAHGSDMLRVDFAVQFVSHRCGEPKAD